MEDNKLVACEVLESFCSKNFLGKPKFRLFKLLGVRKLPTPDHIRDFVINGNRQGAGAAEVIAAIKIFCMVASILCPLVNQAPLDDDSSRTQ